VVEYGLGGSNYFHYFLWVVLILVVVEYGLGAFGGWPRIVRSVLILVVVEYGLGETEMVRSVAKALS